MIFPLVSPHSLNGSNIHLDAHTSKRSYPNPSLSFTNRVYYSHIAANNCPKYSDLNSMSYYRTVSVSQESGHDSVVDLWLQVSPDITGKLLLKAAVSSRLYWVWRVCFQTHLCSMFFQTSVSYRLLDWGPQILSLSCELLHRTHYNVAACCPQYEWTKR